MADEPLMNQPEARTAEGTIQDQVTTTSPISSPTTPTEKVDAQVEAPKAPEKYDFKLPEGVTLDQPTLDSASAIFKELGLDQTAAQKLIDFQVNRDKAASESGQKAIEEMRMQWRDATAKDPVLAGKLEQAKIDIGRAYAQLPPQLVTEFKQQMDATGIGDHPTFIKMFWNFAKLVNEGQHVSGAGPSGEGQRAPGTSDKPSLAKAMYPNLQ